MEKRIVGVDNGLKGGIVCLEGSNIVLKSVMPVIAVVKSKKDYIPNELFSLIKDCNPDHIVIEKAQVMVKKGVSQGTVSSFKTGYGFGLTVMVAVALQIPYTIVPPKTWQKVMFLGLPTSSDTKNLSYIQCQKLWPEESWLATSRSRVFHDGLCDAAMIAEWGRRALKV